IVKLAYPRGHCRPYVFAGVGGHDSTLTLSGVPAPGVPWPLSGQLIDKSSKGAAFGGGIGLDIFMTDSFFMGLEYRVIDLAHVRSDVTADAKNTFFTSKDDSFSAGI